MNGVVRVAGTCPRRRAVRSLSRRRRRRRWLRSAARRRQWRPLRRTNAAVAADTGRSAWEIQPAHSRHTILPLHIVHQSHAKRNAFTAQRSACTCGICRLSVRLSVILTHRVQIAQRIKLIFGEKLYSISVKPYCIMSGFRSAKITVILRIFTASCVFSFLLRDRCYQQSDCRKLSITLWGRLRLQLLTVNVANRDDNTRLLLSTS